MCEGSALWHLPCPGFFLHKSQGRRLGPHSRGSGAAPCTLGPSAWGLSESGEALSLCPFLERTGLKGAAPGRWDPQLRSLILRGTWLYCGCEDYTCL